MTRIQVLAWRQENSRCEENPPLGSKAKAFFILLLLHASFFLGRQSITCSLCCARGILRVHWCLVRVRAALTQRKQQFLVPVWWQHPYSVPTTPWMKLANAQDLGCALKLCKKWKRLLLLTVGRATRTVSFSLKELPLVIRSEKQMRPPYAIRDFVWPKSLLCASQGLWHHSKRLVCLLSPPVASPRSSNNKRIHSSRQEERFVCSVRIPHDYYVGFPFSWPDLTWIFNALDEETKKSVECRDEKKKFD